MTSIPSPRLILTDVINQITALHISAAHPPPTKKAHDPLEDDESPPPNPMKGLPLPAQDLLIALDYLLPSGIGQALDVLDRGLVTRYQLKHEEPVEGENISSIVFKEAAEKIGEDFRESSRETPSITHLPPNRYLYHVTSSEPPPKNRGRYTKRFTPKVYTVRVGSWYCGCEAFTMAAFTGKSTPIALAGDVVDDDVHKEWKNEEEGRVWQHMENSEWVWGGAMLGVESPPVCKHLVACALAEHCGGLFMNYVKEVELGFDEMIEKSLGPRVYGEKAADKSPLGAK